MSSLFESVVHLAAGAETLARRPYGVIEVRDGQLVAVHLRPWPKFVSIFSVVWGQLYHRHARGDRMLLYYNQPRRCPTFLALKFALSARSTSLATATKALEVLDQIAHVKRTDALLCDAANFRLSGRMLARYGWEPHAPSRWHRNYIKRLYVDYPRLYAPAGDQPTLAPLAPAILAS